MHFFNVNIILFLSFAKNSEFGMVGYNAINTLTENGSVKRGVCEVKNDKLVRVEVF